MFQNIFSLFHSSSRNPSLYIFPIPFRYPFQFAHFPPFYKLSSPHALPFPSTHFLSLTHLIPLYTLAASQEPIHLRLTQYRHSFWVRQPHN